MNTPDRLASKQMDILPLKLSGLPSASYIADRGGCVMTFGTFDGVTIGHQNVLTHVLQRATSIEAVPVAVIFRPRPSDTLGIHDPRPYFTAQDETIRLIRSFGLKAGVLSFNKRLSLTKASVFLRRLLMRIPIRELVLRNGATVGRGPEGTAKGIQGIAHNLGFQVSYVDPTDHPNLFHAFFSKDMKKVQEVLTRPYKLPAWLLASQHSSSPSGIDAFQAIVPKLLHLPPDGQYSVQVTPATYRDAIPHPQARVARAALIITTAREDAARAELRLLTSPGSMWDQSFVTLAFIDALRYNERDLLDWASRAPAEMLP